MYYTTKYAAVQQNETKLVKTSYVKCRPGGSPDGISLKTGMYQRVRLFLRMENLLDKWIIGRISTAAKNGLRFSGQIRVIPVYTLLR